MSYFLNAGHYWYVWHEVLKGPQSRYRPSKYRTPEDFIANWEEVLKRRVEEAREGRCRGIGDSSRRLMRLIENPSNSPERLKTAPNRVRDRHRISLPARRMIGEEITAEEDARDVLDFFTNLHLPRRTGRFPGWTGIRTARATLKDKFAELVEILKDCPWV